MIPAGERPTWIEATLREAFDPEHLELCDESHHHDGHPGAKGGGQPRGISIPQGQRVAARQLIDIAPTILEAFRLPTPPDMQGRAIGQ